MSDGDLLTVERRGIWWTVQDLDGAVWWPYLDAHEEIETSEDPEATALRICYDEPMRGRWHS